MTDIGHIAYPFRWGPHGNAVELEQDTLDDIVNCVEVIVRTDIGALEDLPEMGIDDPTFQHTTNVLQLSAQINLWEPRANVQINAKVDSVDQLVEVVTLDVATRG